MPEIRWAPTAPTTMRLNQIPVGTWFMSAARDGCVHRLYFRIYGTIVDVTHPQHTYSDSQLDWVTGYYPVAVTVSY